MGVFKKLFGGGKKVSKETAETRGDHMPDLKIPVDEKFTIYFKKMEENLFTVKTLPKSPKLSKILFPKTIGKTIFSILWIQDWKPVLLQKI